MAGDDEPGRCPDAHDDRGAWDTGALHAQALAARRQSALLARELQAARRRTSENWQLVRDAWGRAEQIRAQRLAARAGADQFHAPGYARLQARLADMTVIEQAKGIIMAQYGWPEDQAFDALRRAAQRENIKVRDLAASIVARIARQAPPAGRPRQAPAQRHAHPAPATAQPAAEVSPNRGPGGSGDRHQASA